MNTSRRAIGILLPTLLLLVGAACKAAEDAPLVEPVTIWSDGTRMAGDLWKPHGLAPGEKRPAVLLVHGWGGTKAHLNQAYAPQFAALGYVVLTFDYRGWGDSDGKLVRRGEKPGERADKAGGAEFTAAVTEIRQVVDPLDQLEDIRAAYHFLIGEPHADAERLAIWGSSLGGGLALQTAATLPGFRVLITQVGSVNPQAGADRGSDGALSDAAITAWRSARARGEVPPYPGEESAVEGLQGYPDWPEFVRYDPWATKDGLTAATLIIDAAEEELFDIRQNGRALFDAIKARVPARYEALPGAHYDIYRGESYRKALELEKAWLETHLPL